MRKHPTDEELIRLCLARDDEPPMADVSVHLQSGCEECARRTVELRVVLAGLSAPALTDVPEPILRRALEWVSAQETLARVSLVHAAGEPESERSRPIRSGTGVARRLAEAVSEILQEVRALLVLDSRAGMALQGVRGAALADARQLLYESSAGSIHLLVDPAEDGTLRIQGQYLPADGAPVPEGGRALTIGVTRLVLEPIEP
jgi:hypothetical protein